MSETKYDLQAKPQNEMKFSYGGQAVIEGVMMRGAHIFAVAARDPQKNIVIHEGELNKTLYRGRIAKTPFVRGIVGLWDALGLGTRALMWSADVALQEETPEGEEPKESINFNGPLGWGTVAFSLLLGVGLFFLLPTAAATGIGNALGLSQSYIVEERVNPASQDILDDGTTSSETSTTTEAQTAETAATGETQSRFDIGPLLINLIEGVIQLGILIAYIALIGLMPDVKRLFGYHGAEHKTINAYEAGAELIPSVVAKYPIEHPRCGTAFLLTVVFVSVFIFSLLGRPPFILLILSRVILIPVIAGVAYELLRWTARNIDKPWVRAIVTPNLMLQHLTTRQPDEGMIEVAIAAFKRVLVSEGVIPAEEAAPVITDSAQPAPTPAGD